MDVLLTVLESYTDRNERDTRDPDSDPDLHLVGKYTYLYGYDNNA